MSDIADRLEEFAVDPTVVVTGRAGLLTEAAAEIRRLEGMVEQRDRMLAKAGRAFEGERHRAEKAEATLARIKALPEKWRAEPAEHEGVHEMDALGQSEMCCCCDTLNTAKDELEAALSPLKEQD